MVDCILTVTRESTETPYEVGCTLIVMYDKPIFTSTNLLPIVDYITDFKERYPHMEVSTNIQVPFEILTASLKEEKE